MRALLATLLSLLCCSLAQPRLVIDGLDIPGNTTSLLPGRSYAPARALALALGAELGIDGAGGSASVQLGGRLVRVVVFGDPAAAEAAQAAFTVDGVPRDAPGGLLVGGELYLPVQPLIEAFGGQIAFLPEEGTVVATLPRAQVTSVALERSGAGERVRIGVSAPVGFSTFFNEPLSVLQLRLERANLQRAETLTGARIERADIIPGSNHVDVRVSVPDSASYEVYTVPGEGGAFELFVALRDRAAEPVAAHRGGIVLDAGHGGSDRGAQFGSFGFESDLTLGFVQALGGELEALGFEVDYTRDATAAPPLSSRLSLGVGADLFVSVHAAALPAGRYNLYHLADAADARILDLALRSNAETALRSETTDGVRRDILLGLLSDLEVGRRFADSLERQLLQLTGYQVAEAAGMPLYVLTGAAGRGLFVELSPADLVDADFAGAFAAALATVLSSGGFE